MIAERSGQEQFVPKGERCLPEFYSERLINVQGPLTAAISGVTFQNQMTLPLPDYTTTCYNVYTYIYFHQFVHPLIHLYLHFLAMSFVGL